MNNLVKKLRPGSFPLFDYAALNDPDLEQRLRTRATKIHEYERLSIVGIGRELIAAKKELPDGTFLKWIGESFNFTRRTANRMMQVAAEFGDSWDTVSHLQPGTLYLLAAPSTPPEVRSTVLANIGPGRVVSTANVRELIDSIKTSEIRKRRHDRREEEKKEREAQRVKWQAEHDRDRARLNAEREKARDACEQIRSFLGDYYPEVCELLSGCTRYAFTEALFLMAESDRSKRNDGGGE